MLTSLTLCHNGPSGTPRLGRTLSEVAMPQAHAIRGCLDVLREHGCGWSSPTLQAVAKRKGLPCQLRDVCYYPQLSASGNAALWLALLMNADDYSGPDGYRQTWPPFTRCDLQLLRDMPNREVSLVTTRLLWPQTFGDASRDPAGDQYPGACPDTPCSSPPTPSSPDNPSAS